MNEHDGVNVVIGCVRDEVDEPFEAEREPDGGNVLALAWRARGRGIDVSTVTVALGEPLAVFTP